MSEQLTREESDELNRSSIKTELLNRALQVLTHESTTVRHKDIAREKTPW